METDFLALKIDNYLKNWQFFGLKFSFNP